MPYTFHLLRRKISARSIRRRGRNSLRGSFSIELWWENLVVEAWASPRRTSRAACRASSALRHRFLPLGLGLETSLRSGRQPIYHYFFLPEPPGISQSPQPSFGFTFHLPLSGFIVIQLIHTYIVSPCNINDPHHVPYSIIFFLLLAVIRFSCTPQNNVISDAPYTISLSLSQLSCNLYFLSYMYRYYQLAVKHIRR